MFTPIPRSYKRKSERWGTVVRYVSKLLVEELPTYRVLLVVHAALLRLFIDLGSYLLFTSHRAAGNVRA